MDGVRELTANITDQDILQDAYALWREIDDFESETRKKMRDDILFEAGETWDKTTKQTREGLSRPALSIPRINQFTNHIKNSLRQSKPSIKVSARGADSEIVEQKRIKAAENRQGLIRAIQYDSQAVDAYQHAFDEAVTCGRGFILITTDYVSDKTFDQEIKIDFIRNGLNVYIDKAREKPDYSDATHGFILTKMRREVFKAKYPDADPVSWEPTSDNKWFDSDFIWVVDFWCIWAKKREFFRLPNGITGYTDEITGISPEAQEEVKAAMAQPETKKRKVLAPQVWYYKMTATEILEKKPILGKYIPIIPILGVEKIIDGNLEIKGLVRDMKDICKMYNYAASQEAERLSMSPKIPYVAATGQIEGYEKLWENANDSSISVLPYKPVSVGGHLVGAPQRQQPIPIDSGLIQAKQGYLDDMKAVSGIDYPSLGMLGPERSGVAIQELKRGADIANLHYMDNMRICINHAGRIINNWLPEVYDTRRIVKILGEELDEKEIELGARDQDMDEITLGDGDYDVVVTMGANFNTKRQESMEFMMELVRVAPQITPLIYDLLVKNMDAPGAQEISERLKKTIPPEILDEQGGEKQLAAQLQQAMQQLRQSAQVTQMLQAQLEQAMQALRDKDAEMAKDLEVARINQEGKIAVADINAKSKAMLDASNTARMYWQTFQTNQQSTQPGVRQ